MNNIEAFQNLFRNLPENITFLVNNQKVEYDRNGLWFTISEKYIFWKDIAEVKLEEENADDGEQWDNIVATFIDSFSNRYEVEMVIRPNWKMIEEIKNNKSSFSYIEMERKVVVE